MKAPTVRNGLQPSVPERMTFKKPSLTKQAHRDECDINKIMARYEQTGVLDHVAKYGGRYGDMDGATFQDHMFKIAEAKSMFQELPARARRAFNDDPAQFLDYVSQVDDIEHDQRMIDLGLVDAKTAKTYTPNQPDETSSELPSAVTAQEDNSSESSASEPQ